MRDPTRFLSEEYQELVDKALDWRLKTIQGPSEPVAMVDGREVLILCSNNYLGLTTHPKLKEAAIQATHKYGVGSGAVRAISGTMDLHMELEKKLAKYKRSDS
jgi:glycine C-acetyltransferase